MLDLINFDYQFVTSRALDTARSLIELYDLHAHPRQPTEIVGLLTHFEVRFYDDLPDTTWGFSLDLGRKIIIGINNQLNTAQTRYVAMHEVGHIACYHPNQLHTAQMHQWLCDQLETEATTVAALLLVPHDALASPGRYQSISELAQRYLVPPELAAIRRVLYQRTGL